MAENIRDIKRRIRSVNNTRQITKAMEMVSSSKLRRAREGAELGRPYFEKMIETIGDIVRLTGKVRNPYMEIRQVKNKAFIIITADRGLAGGYNNNAIKIGVAAMDDKDQVSIYALGSRGRDYFQRREYKIIKEYIGISDSPSVENAKEISESVMKLFAEGDVDEVYLVYTKFISTITQDPQILKLLPISYEETEVEGKQAKEDNGPKLVVNYEPSAESVLRGLIPRFIQNTIYGAMVESAASEQGARRVAMESATDNANEIIDELSLTYNRARQAAITQEITEIVGGAEALR